MKEVNFLNLTNGLEFIESVDNPQFIRIRSTTLERKNYLFLLMDLDHNLLMNIALGNICKIYDCGTNRKMSKTIYLGVPFIRYALTRRWLGEDNEAFRYSRDGLKSFNISRYFQQSYNEIFVWNQNSEKGKLKTKLDYYKKFLNTEALNIEGVSQSTNMDGKNFYWKEKAFLPQIKEVRFKAS